MFTLNEVGNWQQLRDYLIKRKNLTYLIAALEKAPTTEHEHMHIYTQFNKPTRILFEKVFGAHVDKCRGTPQQVHDYVIKDNKIIEEYGTLRKTGGRTIADVKLMDKEDREFLPISYYNIVNKINDEEDKLNAFNQKKILMSFIYSENQEQAKVKTRLKSFVLIAENMN